MSLVGKGNSTFRSNSELELPFGIQPLSYRSGMAGHKEIADSICHRLFKLTTYLDSPNKKGTIVERKRIQNIRMLADDLYDDDDDFGAAVPTVIAPKTLLGPPATSSKRKEKVKQDQRDIIKLPQPQFRRQQPRVSTRKKLEEEGGVVPDHKRPDAITPTPRLTLMKIEKTTQQMKTTIKEALKIDIYLRIKGYWMHMNGKLLETVCPLHDDTLLFLPGKGDKKAYVPENTFKIAESREFWYCSSCHLRGDVLTLMMEIEKISLEEALGVCAYLLRDTAALAVFDSFREREQEVVAVEEVTKIEYPDREDLSTPASHHTSFQLGEVNPSEELRRREKYIDECSRQGVIPIGTFKRQGEDTDVNLSHLYMRVPDVRAMAKILQPDQYIQRLFLADNALGDAGILELCGHLCQNTSVHTLDLSCNNIRFPGARAIAKLLSNTVGNVISNHLLFLRANANHIGAMGKEVTSDGEEVIVSGATLIAQALLMNSKLRYLELSSNGINPVSGKAFGYLLGQNNHLIDIDLSWNELGPASAVEIGDGLCYNSTLKRLITSWCGFGDKGCQAICEGLNSNQALTWVDLSCNHITENSAHILAHTISANNTLALLELNYNPLEPQGCKVILEAIKFSANIAQLGLVGSTTAIGETSSGFDVDNPNGAYALNLKNPEERVIAIKLVQLAKHAQTKTWQNEKFNGFSFTFGENKFASWPEDMPKEGLLEFNFVSFSDSSAAMEVLDENDFSICLSGLSNNRLSDFEKLKLLRIWIKATFFTVQQVREIVQLFQYSNELVEAVITLFPKVSDIANFHSVLAVLKDNKKVVDRLGWLLYMHPNNPTGHYKLSLQNASERELAHKLLQMTRRDPGSRWRNVTLDGHPYTFDVSTWAIPSMGQLWVDFVAGSRACTNPEAEPMSDEDFKEKIESLAQVEDTQERLRLLRWNSNFYYYSVKQIMSLVPWFDSPVDQAGLLVTFFARLTDSKENMWLLMRSLSKEGQRQASSRLGWSALLDEKHPEFHYQLRQADAEERAITARLLELCKKFPGQNFNNVHVDGKPFRFGDMSSMEYMPTDAILDFDFMTGKDAQQAALQAVSTKASPKPVEEPTQEKPRAKPPKGRRGSVKPENSALNTSTTSLAAASDGIVTHSGALNTSTTSLAAASDGIDAHSGGARRDAASDGIVAHSGGAGRDTAAGPNGGAGGLVQVGIGGDVGGGGGESAPQEPRAEPIEGAVDADGGGDGAAGRPVALSLAGTSGAADAEHGGSSIQEGDRPSSSVREGDRPASSVRQGDPSLSDGGGEAAATAAPSSRRSSKASGGGDGAVNVAAGGGDTVVPVADESGLVVPGQEPTRTSPTANTTTDGDKSRNQLDPEPGSTSESSGQVLLPSPPPASSRSGSFRRSSVARSSGSAGSQKGS